MVLPRATVFRGEWPLYTQRTPCVLPVDCQKSMVGVDGETTLHHPRGDEGGGGGGVEEGKSGGGGQRGRGGGGGESGE